MNFDSKNSRPFFISPHDRSFTPAKLFVTVSTPLPLLPLLDPSSSSTNISTTTGLSAPFAVEDDNDDDGEIFPTSPPFFFCGDGAPAGLLGVGLTCLNPPLHRPHLTFRGSMLFECRPYSNPHPSQHQMYL